MMRRLTLWYPFVFMLLPILTIVTRSPGESSLPDIAIVAGAALAGCAMVYGVLALIFRGRSRHVVPLIVFALILWFYAYDALSTRALRIAGGGGAPAVIGLAALVTIGLVWWLARRPHPLERVNTFLTLTGLLLFVWSGLRFIRDELRSGEAVRNSALARELARPLPANHKVLNQPRDIYLLVLDEYANSSVLRERFGFDNRSFEDSLRQLGFTVPRQFRSNYVHTILSLPSLLNFSHLTQLSQELGPKATDPTLPNHLVENNRVVSFLKGRGYKFLFFPSQWWFSTAHNRNADWEFHAWNGFQPGREATRSDLRRSFVRSTLLDRFHKDHAWDADHVRRTLAGLQLVPQRPEATFAFAHLINPHGPYALAADCETLKARLRDVRWPAGGGMPYIEQLQCLNRMVLSVVTRLLEQSAGPPIILIVGDHGTNSLRYSSAKSARHVSSAQARERFGAFGAFYLPDGGGQSFPDTVTLVNVFRNVLNHYFDAEIPAVPDDLYMSLERTPFDFVRVDPSSLQFPGTSNAGSAGASRVVTCGPASAGVSWRRVSLSERAYRRISRPG